MASAAAGLLAVPAVAGEEAQSAQSNDVQAQLTQMQELVKGLQQKVDAQEEQLQHQNQLLQDAQRVVRADEQGSVSGLAAFLDSIDVDGAVIASYNYNFNTAADTFQNGSFGDGGNAGASGLFMPFHRDANSFQVDQAWFGLGKPATEESRGGFRFDIGFGAFASVFGTGNVFNRASNSSDSTSDYVVDQAYVEYLAPVAKIDLKMGKFDTPVGAENIRQWQNFNITRGILYTLLQPVNHVGIIGTVPVGDMAEIGAGLVNSAGSIISAPDDSNEKSYLATAKVGDQRANVRASFLYGSEPTIATNFNQNPGHANGDQVGLADVTAWFNPSDSISLWANYDYLFVEHTGYVAQGAAVAGRVALGMLGLDKAGVSVRGEYVQEKPSPGHGTLLIGQTTGEARVSDIWSVTGTVDYALTDHLTVKSELRWDFLKNGGGSDEFAEKDGGDVTFSSKDQLVWLLAAQYVF
jgi:hypothetical protein